MPKFLDKVIMSPIRMNSGSDSYKSQYEVSGLITTIGIFSKKSTDSAYSSLPKYLYLPPLLMSEKDYVENNFWYTGLKDLKLYLKTVLLHQQGNFGSGIIFEFFLPCFTTNNQIDGRPTQSDFLRINLHTAATGSIDIYKVFLGSGGNDLLGANYYIDGDLLCHNIYS